MAQVLPFEAVPVDSAPGESPPSPAAGWPDREVFWIQEWAANGALSVRSLLGRLGPEASPFQRSDRRPSRRHGGTLPSLVPDDHRVLSSLLETGAGAQRPLADLQLPEGRLRLWPVLDPRLGGRLERAVEDLEVRPLWEVPLASPVLTSAIPLSEPGLRLQPVHRGLRGLPHFQPKTFLSLVREFARIIPLEAPLTTGAGRAEAEERLATLSAGTHAVLLVLPDGSGTLLRFRQALELTQIKAVPRSPTLRSLDLALLESLVFKTVLGLEDPDSDDQPHIRCVESFQGLVDEVLGGRLLAGFALNPPPTWELRAVMEARQQLPPATLRLPPQPSELPLRPAG